MIAQLATRRAYRGDTETRVRRFLPMVHRLAWHVHGSGRPGLEPDDLVQAGLVALTECAQAHAGPGEDGFAAYAKVRVRGAMIDLVRRTMNQTRGAADRRRALRRAEESLSAALGRPPSEAELAAGLGIAPPALARLRHESEPLRFESLDEAAAGSDPRFADGGADAFAQLCGAEQRAGLIAAIAALPARQQQVIQLYFVEEFNLTEIAAAIEVSVPRVHQIKAQALAALRNALKEPALS